MRKVLFLLLVVFLVLSFKLFVPQTFSQEDISSWNLDQINNKLNELQRALSASQKATAPLESQLKNLQTQLKGIEDRVAFVERDLAEKKKIIDQGYQELEKNKTIFNKTVRDYYIKSYFLSPLLVFVSQADAADITRIIIYQKRDADRDKETITSIALKIVDLEERKKKLEEEEAKLAGIKEKLASEKSEVEKVVKGAKTYQASLSSEIAKLSARQKEILGQRLAALNIPRSAQTALPVCVDDRTKDPGFSPRMAFFTYGVPNRTGLNQYGAKGRADAGQDYETILRAYYNFDGLADWDTNIKIRVDGHSEYPLDDYVKRIYEMPADWSIEALKAQAIAARSYALAYTNNGSGSICDSQSCQVFKDEEKGGRWNEAVEATGGKVMVQGGSPIKAWYSSTHGGYILSTSELPGWNATSWTKHATDTIAGSAGSFSDLQSNAYDKESPWFYCDWGSRPQYNKTAWLQHSEVADIANVTLLSRQCSYDECGKHLYQTDKPNPAGADTWDENRVRQELQNRGITPFTNASDVSISADFSAGRTTSVTISGNISQSFSGDEFKNWFNLRAPVNIQIVGPLYNVERQ